MEHLQFWNHPIFKREVYIGFLDYSHSLIALQGPMSAFVLNRGMEKSDLNENRKILDELKHFSIPLSEGSDFSWGGINKWFLIDLNGTIVTKGEFTFRDDKTTLKINGSNHTGIYYFILKSNNQIHSVPIRI